MKNLMLIIPCLLFLFFGLACSRDILVSIPASSKDEAIYKTELIGDFENIFYLSVSSVALDYLIAERVEVFPPRIRESSDTSLEGKELAHVVINRDKDGCFWLFFLDAKKPPEILYRKKLN